MVNSDVPFSSRFWQVFCPEVQYLETYDDACAADVALREALWRPSRLWVYMLVLACTIFGASIVLERFLASWGLSRNVVVIIIGVTCSMIGGLGMILVCRREVIRIMRKFLQEQGVAICLLCGYDLRGQMTPRCPECGTAFDEQLIDETRASN